MPSRKSIKPPPSFSFVAMNFDEKEVNWLKIHSRSLRSHAAYWGGAVKYQKQSKNPSSGLQSNDARTTGSKTDSILSYRNESRVASECLIVSSQQHRKCTRQRNADPNVKFSMVGSEAIRGIDSHFNDLQYLLPGLTETRPINSRFPDTRTMFEFFGHDFVHQFIISNHQDSLTMLSACRLLSYAHSMSPTGLGTKTMILELKSQVIQNLTANLKSSNFMLSPQGLVAILALSAPIVCLMSHDLPKRLSMWDYLILSMKDDAICCPESAETARRALYERILHLKATRRLFDSSSARYRDAKSTTLLRYVSNCMNMSMALEAANYQSIASAEVAGLFPLTESCNDCLIPDAWTSPLTSQSVAGTSTAPLGRKILVLARTVQRWFSTFLDGSENVSVPTKQVLQDRRALRQNIESFEPVTAALSPEWEAMYECCRWSSLVMLAVENLSIPIHAAAKQVRIQPRLIRRLRMTDLRNLWGPQRGLLFWVASICHFSTAGQCFPLLGTTIFARITQDIALSNYFSASAIKPLKRLKHFETLCCTQEQQT